MDFLTEIQWSSLSSLIFLIVVALPITYYAVNAYMDYLEDIAFAAQNGCQPPPQLPNRRFLGIDRLKELWDSDADGRLLAFLCETAVEYEPRNNLSQFFLLGPRVFHTLHPRNVEAVLSTDFQDYSFGDRHGVFAPLLGNGIFTQEGAAWRHSREVLRKQFGRIQYQNLDRFREHVDNLLARLPQEAGVVDLQPLFFDFTLDTTTALLFGKSVYSLKADGTHEAENKEFAESFTLALEGLAKRFRLAPWHFLYSPPKFRRACSRAHRFVENYIEERSSHRDINKDESSAFIDQVAEESATATDLRDQLLNILLAGRDSTACCLSWTMRLLARHPRVMERLRQEITSVMGTEEHPTRAQIRKMGYLSFVIKESLRLYPPVPLNNRCAVRTTMLPTGGGPDGNSPIMVRRGEVVVMSQYVNSRKKNLYGEDAYDFRPERWERGEVDGIGYGYFPFNGGPRSCLGEDFAIMEVCYTVVRLFQNFSSITLPLGEINEPVGTEKQRLTLVLSSADGCRVSFVR